MLDGGQIFDISFTTSGALPLPVIPLYNKLTNAKIIVEFMT